MDLDFDMVISRACVVASVFFLLVLSSCATVDSAQGDRLDLIKITADSRATVLVWWATQCPCVTRYQARIEALAKRYASQGVSFYAISSNSDDSASQVQEVAKQRGFDLPILMDVDGNLAKQLGVRTTPTIVIADQRGNVKYRGWVDNERFEGDSQRIAYVENAL